MLGDLLKKVKAEKERITKEIKELKSLKELENLSRKIWSKKGNLAKFFSLLKKVPEKERRKFGKELNILKETILAEIEKKEREIKEKEISEKLKREKIDVTLSGPKIELGHLHPLTLVFREILRIFSSLGFEIVEGPELETEWYNFDALNIPKEHPARDLWDTFWIKTNKNKSNFLLRTHTSPVQVRYLEKHNPPLRIIVPGRVFRFEKRDAFHDIQFFQLEGLMVDEDISAANFLAIIQEFLKRFYKKEVELRLRPSYFPFTEPSFEVDVREKGKKEWLELLGAGMVHPFVFKNAGLNPKLWQGFAFGIGVDRLAMIRYKIEDIRLFYKGDLRFLRQF